MIECTNCGYKRPPKAEILSFSCPACNAEYTESQKVEIDKRQSTHSLDKNYVALVLSIVCTSMGVGLLIGANSVEHHRYELFLGLYFLGTSLILTGVWLISNTKYPKTIANAIKKSNNSKLTSCKDCGREVSKTAKSCPHCGVANPGITTQDYMIAIITLSIVAFAFYLWPNGDGSKNIPTELDDIACKADLQCWGDRNSIAASFKCDDKIEKLAKYSFKWTDGLLGVKFSNFKWKNTQMGQITYIGDSIQFQNGMGAWQNYSYQCDYDPATESVLNVIASPGRLD